MLGIKKNKWISNHNNIDLIVKVTIQKKRGIHLLSIPRAEAFALPIQ